MVVTSHDGLVGANGTNGHGFGATTSALGGGGGGPASSNTPAIQTSDRDPGAASHFLPSKGDFSTATNNSSLSASASSDARRKSTSSTTRPTLNPDIYNYYPYVPKVKLGPRPHVEVPKRPQTATDSRPKAFHTPTNSIASASSVKTAEELRAAVPRSVLIQSRKGGAAFPTRADSLNALSAYGIELPQPPTESIPYGAPSVFSLPNLPGSGTSITSSVAESTITPEKTRLMRALQLRRQQKVDQEQKPKEQEQQPVQQSDSSIDSVVALLEEEEVVRTPTATEMPVTVVEPANVQIVEQGPKSPGQKSATQECAVMDDEDETTMSRVATDGDVSSNNEVAPEEIINAPTTDVADNAGTPDIEGSNQTVVEEPASLNEVIIPDTIAADANVNSTTTTHDHAKVEEVRKEEGPTHDELKEDAPPTKEETPVRSPGVDEIDSEKKEDENTEEVVAIEVPRSPVEGDKVEGTKVRDDVSESDHESITSLEAPAQIVTLTPVSPTSAAFPQSIASPVSATSVHHTTTKAEPEQPNIIKKDNRSSSIPPTSPAPVETARSVSAPFLKTPQEKPSVAPRKTGPAGSVSQRIRQFQQLAATPAPARTPSVSRGSSPTPEWANRARSDSINQQTPSALRKPSFSGAAIQRASSSASQRSFNMGRPQTPTEERGGQMLPPPVQRPRSIVRDVPGQIEVVKKDNKPQLQVTTKIHRTDFVEVRSSQHLRHPSKSDISSLSPKAKSPTATPIPQPTPEEERDMKTLHRRSMDITAAVERMVPRRGSVDLTGSQQRRHSPDQEGAKDQRSRLFSRSSTKDLGKVPEDSISSSAGSRRGSTSKSPSFLRRMSSSLSRKKDSPSPVEAATSPVLPPKAKTPPPPPVPAQKTYLLAGWLNVQLPDTMLWRRRSIKIDATGWLFLSLTDDEVCPSPPHSSIFLVSILTGLDCTEHSPILHPQRRPHR